MHSLRNRPIHVTFTTHEEDAATAHENGRYTGDMDLFVEKS